MSDTKVIPMEIRRGQLAELLSALEDLIAVLELDPKCHWISHFERCFEIGRRFDDTVTQDDLNAFSSSVASVYGGMDSFNDYCPCPPHERKKPADRLHSFENFDSFAGAVYERAIELRVVGNW